MINIDENKNVAVESEVEPTTQTNSPQVEVPSTEEQTAQLSADQPKEEVATDVKEEPKDPREYQIKRLSEENRRLKSEKQGSAFDAFKPQAPTQQQVDVRNYTDEYGQVNYQAYNQAVNSHIQSVANQTVEELLDEREAKQNFPDLFADPEVEQEIADLWYGGKMKSLFDGTKAPSISEISERVARRYRKDVSKAEKRGMEKALTEVTVKEQAGMSVSGQTSSGARQLQAEEQNEVLSQATRFGDDDALVARMRNVPWANK